MYTTKQRLVLIVPVAIAVLAGVLLWINNKQGTPTADSSIIESISPDRNSSTLQQAAVSIDLQSGWDASLVIDGRAIPDDQLDKVTAQGTVTFQPGPGKEFEFLQAGQNCVVATYWPLNSPDQKFTTNWCFTAT
jgi:hypothetical protein